MIEVIIVLAIVGIMFFIIFLVVPELQRNERNYSRKRTVELVAGALEEYNQTYGSYPRTNADVNNFKNANPEITKLYGFQFREGSLGHTYWPPEDTIGVQYAHWCNRYSNGDNATDPIAGNDIQGNLYAIWTILEPDNPGDPAKRNVFCVDNYDHAPNP